MKISRIIILLVLVVLYTVACGERSPPEEHVFQNQVDALDKAKQVEQQLSEAEKERRKKIQQQF